MRLLQLFQQTHTGVGRERIESPQEMGLFSSGPSSLSPVRLSMTSAVSVILGGALTPTSVLHVAMGTAALAIQE